MVNKRLEGKLREQGGAKAWATVLESKQQWSSSGGVNKVAGQAGSLTIHQKLKLRVEPEAEEPFEVTLKRSSSSRKQSSSATRSQRHTVAYRGPATNCAHSARVRSRPASEQARCSQLASDIGQVNAPP